MGVYQTFLKVRPEWRYIAQDDSSTNERIFRETAQVLLGMQYILLNIVQAS